MPCPSRSRGRRRWVFPLVASSGVIAVGLVMGEVVIRVFDLGPQFSPVSRKLFRVSDNVILKYEHLPGARAGDQIINRDGNRGRELPQAKSPGTFRIACMGDSITFGFGVGEDQTYAWRLEEILNRYLGTDKRRFEVLNFGVTGYNARQSVEALRARALAYDPDLVIYEYCLNDPEQYSREFDRLTADLTNAHLNYIECKIYNPSRIASRSRLYLLTRYVWESTTYLGKTTGLRGARIPFSFTSMHDYVRHYTRIHLDKEKWTIVSRCLASMGELAARRDLPIYVVIFPVFKHLGDYQVEDLHRQVAREARSHSLPVIDLLDDYQRLLKLRGATFFVDSIHPDAAGHTYAALVMLRTFLADGVLPVRDGDLSRLLAPDEPYRELARLLMRPE